MKGSRPPQGELTKHNDPTKRESTRQVIEGMVDGLNDHRIADIGEFFTQSFRWMGNAGCGTKNGLKEFQDNWQKPFQAAFSDKVCVDEARLFDGEWAAAMRYFSGGTNVRAAGSNAFRRIYGHCFHR